MLADGSEKANIIFKIPCTHQPHFVEVGSEDVRIFIDGSILDDNSVTSLDVDDLLETVVEEIYLQVKGPAGHVLIEVVQVWVVFYIFISGFPVIMASQQVGEGGFACTNIACYSNVLDIMLIVDGRKFYMFSIKSRYFSIP